MRAAAREGPKTGIRLRAERVRESGGERRLGSDHDEIGLFSRGQPHDRRNVVRAHRHAAAERRDSWIPGCGDDLDRRLILLELPGERVLAPTATDDQSPHAGGGPPLEPPPFPGPRNAVLKASRARVSTSPTLAAARRDCSA